MEKVRLYKAREGKKTGINLRVPFSMMMQWIRCRKPENSGVPVAVSICVDFYDRNTGNNTYKAVQVKQVIAIGQCCGMKKPKTIQQGVTEMIFVTR